MPCRCNPSGGDEAEDDAVTWTTWKFCTRDRIRNLLHGEPAANPELRALGLVETFSRTYSQPVLKSVIEFARAFKEDSESCAFRGRTIKYGKEELRRVFSLPSGPFSDVTVSWSSREMKNLFTPSRFRKTFAISCLKNKFKSWGGPIRLVQELLLGKQQPTLVTKKHMWYFFAHLSGSVEPGKPKPDWADLVLDVLKTEIEKLKIHLKKTPTKARVGTWGGAKCPVLCGTALMAILTYHGFSEEELSGDWEEHGTSTKGPATVETATNEPDVERACREPATVETRQREKRRRDLDGDGEEPVRAVTRQMAQTMASKKILRRHKKRKSSRPEIVAASGLANIPEAEKNLGESIGQQLLRQEVDSLQKKREREREELRTEQEEKINENARRQEELHTEQMEKMKENARIYAGLQKAQEEVSEYRRKLLESQEDLHTQQMAKNMNENANLQALLTKTQEEAIELKKKLFESEVKTRKAHVSSQGWKDTWEAVSKALDQAKAEIQNLTLRVGFLSTASEMAGSMKKKLEDENAVLRKQLRLQKVILEDNSDEGASEDWNRGSASARLASENNAIQTGEPTGVLLSVRNAVTAGPSRAQAAPQTMEANITPKSEPLHDS